VSSDQSLPAALDHILSGVRAQLEVELRTYADRLVRSAADDRDRALAQAAQSAAEERQRALEQAARTAAAEQQRALAELAETLRQQARAELDDARRAAETQLHEERRAREAAEASISELQRERTAAEARLHALHLSVDARQADLAAERDRLRAELAAAQRQLHELERRELDKRERDERAAAARLGGHVVPAVRALDESASLEEVLVRLTAGALTHCDRAMLLMLRSDRLHAWHSLGFEEGEAELHDLSAEAAGIAGTAARENRVLTHRGDAGTLPSFVSSTDVSEASALPVTVGGAVVAVLYADVAEERLPDSAWVADLEVLTRHAGRMLETLTMQGAAGLRPVGVARPSHASSGPSAGMPPAGSTPGGIS
jgi:hypothetical protein